MFEIIFSNQVFDPMCVYDWGKLATTIISTAINKKTEIVSAIEAITPTVQAEIQKTVDYYME